MPPVSSIPVIRPAICFRGRVLVLDEMVWPRLSQKDLDGALLEWISP